MHADSLKNDGNRVAKRPARCSPKAHTKASAGVLVFSANLLTNCKSSLWSYVPTDAYESTEDKSHSMISLSVTQEKIEFPPFH